MLRLSDNIIDTHIGIYIVIIPNKTNYNKAGGNRSNSKKAVKLKMDGLKIYATFYRS